MASIFLVLVALIGSAVAFNRKINVIVTAGAQQINHESIIQGYFRFFYDGYSDNVIRLPPALPTWTKVTKRELIVRAIRNLDLSDISMCVTYEHELLDKPVENYLIFDRPPCDMMHAMLAGRGKFVIPLGVGPFLNATTVANLACPSCPHYKI